MWPDLMKRETLAKRMDIEPGYVDQLVKRGCIPGPHKVGEALLWSWMEVDTFIRKGKIGGEPDQVDPYDAGVMNATEATTTRKAGAKPHRASVLLPNAAQGNR